MKIVQAIECFHTFMYRTPLLRHIAILGDELAAITIHSVVEARKIWQKSWREFRTQRCGL
ncbi:MAG: hypothetical protein AAB655_02575 [Patescibacteria group bacterium]